MNLPNSATRLVRLRAIGHYTLWSGRVGLPKLVDVEWLESDPGLFTPGMIEKLREEYSKLRTVPADGLDRCHKLFDKMTVVQLSQLVEAKIRFVSPLAANERFRRESALSVK